MITRVLRNTLLLFAIASGLPSLERPAAAAVHGVQGRKHHRKHHRAQHHERPHHEHDRDRGHPGEL